MGETLEASIVPRSGLKAGKGLSYCRASQLCLSPDFQVKMQWQL